MLILTIVLKNLIAIDIIYVILVALKNVGIVNNAILFVLIL